MFANVYDVESTVRWSSISDDRISRKTGSSVFDFDGDGIAEVVYKTTTGCASTTVRPAT
jgi:hypothetical protein